jgi:signal peptidase II
VTWTSHKRIALLAGLVYLADQLTKLVVLTFLGYAQERIVVDGFFKFVHWGNTGAAWSMFHGNNTILAVISAVALVLLLFSLRRFEPEKTLGWIALGLVLGGIVGNLTDRLLPTRQHVIDFIYFFLIRRNGGELGFPAFNVADSAICVGVGLLFLQSLRNEAAQGARQKMGPPGLTKV